MKLEIIKTLNNSIGRTANKRLANFLSIFKLKTSLIKLIKNHHDYVAIVYKELLFVHVKI